MPPFREFSSLKMPKPKNFSGPGRSLGSDTATELGSTQLYPEKLAEPSEQSSDQTSLAEFVYNSELVATNLLADYAEQEVEGDINFGPQPSAAQKEQTRSRIPRPAPRSATPTRSRAEPKPRPVSALTPRPTSSRPKQKPGSQMFNAPIVHSNMLSGHAKQKAGGNLNFGG